MEFVSRFQTLVRNVAVALDKPNKERSKCPRCKGSGLLAQRMPWDRKPGALANDPCWFCEGIGVMPVAGLNGFLLGRASSSFHTRDNKASSQLPVDVQLCLGKYPGTRPKFATRKPCDDPKTLLHDFSKLPDWLSGEDFQNLEPSEQRKAMAGGGQKVERSPRTMTPVTGRRNGSSSLFRTKSSRQSRPGSSVPRFSRQLGIASSGTTPRPAPPVPETRNTSASPKQIAEVVPDMKSSKDAMQASENEHTVSSPKLMPVARKSPKHFKAPRRERNRIREEAEKQALERARRKQVLPSDSEMDKPANKGGAPSSGLWTEPSSNWAWASKLPLAPWLEPLKRSSAINHSWLNQMVDGRLKDWTPLSPMLGKAFL